MMLVTLASRAPAVGAQNSGGGTTLYGHLGAVSEGSNGEGLKSGSAFGLALEHRLGGRWGVGGGIAMHFGELTSTVDATAIVVDVHGRYTWDLARVQPYLTTGAGLYHLSPDDFDSSTDFGVPVGGGFDVPLTNRWRVGFNAAHHFVVSEGPSLGGGDAMTWFTWAAIVGFALGTP
jgi:hypothetical protein